MQDTLVASGPYETASVCDVQRIEKAPTKKESLLSNIQFLRFAAALLVVIAHSPLTYFNVPASLTHIGGFGVDIFFIISGFIIPFILFGGKYSREYIIPISAKTFFLRRFFRIWPLYFLMTMVAMACIWLVSSGLFKPNPDLEFAYHPTRYDINMVLRSISFTRFPESPALAVGWTLQFEFMFYSIIAILMAFSARKMDTFIVCYAAIVLVAVLFLSSKFSSLSQYIPMVQLIGSPMMIEFLLGMTLYRLYSDNIFLPKWLAGTFGLAAIPLLLLIEIQQWFPGFAGQFYRAIIWGTIAFIIVWSALSLEGIIKTNKFFELLGDASFSLYLVHWILLPWAAHFYDVLGLYDELGILGSILVYFSISQAIAILVHLKIEKPLNRFFRKMA